MIIVYDLLTFKIKGSFPSSKGGMVMKYIYSSTALKYNLTTSVLPFKINSCFYSAIFWKPILDRAHIIHLNTLVTLQTLINCNVLNIQRRFNFFQLFFFFDFFSFLHFGVTTFTGKITS